MAIKREDSVFFQPKDQTRCTISKDILYNAHIHAEKEASDLETTQEL